MPKITVSQALNGPNGLNATCLGCRRTTHIPKTTLREWDQTKTLDRIETVLKCTECGHVGAVTQLASPHVGGTG